MGRGWKGGREGYGGDKEQGGESGVFLMVVCRTVVELSNREELKKIVRSSIGTKFIKKW